LDLSKNKIVELISFKIVSLQHLNLSDNYIEKVETFEGNPKLRTLELRGNRISTLNGLGNMPELRELYLVF